MVMESPRHTTIMRESFVWLHTPVSFIKIKQRKRGTVKRKASQTLALKGPHCYPLNQSINQRDDIYSSCSWNFTKIPT